MDDIIVKIIELVITIVVLLIGRYAIPYFKSKVGENNYQLILKWAITFVTAAENMILGEKTGEEKRELVTRWIKEKAGELGIKLTDEQVRTILESALAQAKNEGIINAK